MCLCYQKYLPFIFYVVCGYQYLFFNILKGQIRLRSACSSTLFHIFVLIVVNVICKVHYEAHILL